MMHKWEADDERIRAKMRFIVEQRAQFRAGMSELKMEIADLRKAVSQLGTVSEVRRPKAEADRCRLREAIDNLIIANEVTRKIAEEVARELRKSSNECYASKQ